MLVPEVVWLSSISMRVVGGFIMSMGAGVAEEGCGMGIGICMDCMSNANTPGTVRCCVCAWLGSVAKRTNGNMVAASLGGMWIPSLEDCIAGTRRGRTLQYAKR